VLVIVLVFVALAVAGVLLGQVFGDQLFGDDDPSVPGVVGGGAENVPALSLTATAFDPEGDGAEHDDEASLAVDRDLNTAWTSEEYDSPADFSGLKSGVGLVLTFAEASDLGDLGVQTGMEGWSAQVYVADAPAADLGGWGDPVDEQTDIAGDAATFDLSGHAGAAVLLWITNPGTSSPTQASVVEVGLTPA
jgi:hypothetical protein